MPYNVPWIEIENFGNATLNEVRDGKLAMREGLDRIAREADRLLATQ